MAAHKVYKFFGLYLLLSVFLVQGCTLGENSLERLAERAYAPDEGEYPDLRRRLFAAKARFTGILRADRFDRVLGFWIFLRGPHRPELTPVVLVHGHVSGPRPFEPLADSLDPNLFEPWFCYYATGERIKRSASLLRQSLAEMSTRYNEKRIAIIAYSHGGLVTRQALRPADDGVEMPEIPLFVAVSTPWGGSSDTRFVEVESGEDPESWEDMAVGSPFLGELYNDPLPTGTQFHMIYSINQNDRRRIPGEDDRILSKESLGRQEALDEADSVTVFPDVGHRDIIEDVATIGLVNRLLHQIWGRSESPDQTVQISSSQAQSSSSQAQSSD